MKLVFNKKIVFIISAIIIGICVIIFLIIYAPKSIQYVKESKKRKEKELISLEHRADELRLKGDLKQAVEEYKILAEKTKDPYKKLEAEFIQANLYAHQLNDISKAQNIYLNIIKDREKYKENPERVIDTLMEMGLIYWSQKNYEEAAKMHKIALDEYADKIDYPDVAWSLGACYQMLGKREEALKMIEESKKGKEGE